MSKYITKILFVIFVVVNVGLCENTTHETKEITMNYIKKSIQNIHRYKNISTSPSAIKVQLKDKKTKQIINAVIRNDDLYSFFIQEEVIKNPEGYIDYMISNDKKPLEVDLDKFKKAFGGKTFRGEKYFKEHVAFEKPMTFEQLGVRSEEELLKKYFNFDTTKGSGALKVEYYEEYTRNPAFIALLIDLGYDVVWGDYAPILNIYTEPFISNFPTNDIKQK